MLIWTVPFKKFFESTWPPAWPLRWCFYMLRDCSRHYHQHLSNWSWKKLSSQWRIKWKFLVLSPLNSQHDFFGKCGRRKIKWEKNIFTESTNLLLIFSRRSACMGHRSGFNVENKWMTWTDPLKSENDVMTSISVNDFHCCILLWSAKLKILCWVRR